MSTQMLVNSDGQVVTRGDRVVSFRGEPGTLEDWSEPHREGSTGRILVTWESGESGSYYPSVCGLRWTDHDHNSNKDGVQ